MQLFITRAKRARLTFSTTTKDLSHIVRICQLLGGSPLGIELAAVWVKIMSVAEIHEEITQNLAFLKTPTRNLPKRHQSIQAAFEHSWKLLPAREQEVLRNLSVFTGGFRKEAAAEVVGATIPILVSLVDKSLLRISPTGRFDRHPLLYQYTRGKLAAHPKEKTKTQANHAVYYLTLLKLTGAEALGTLDVELENIQTAWQWSAAGSANVQDLRRFAEPLGSYFDQRHRYQEGIDTLAMAVTKLSESEPTHRGALGTLLVEQGWLNFQLGHFDEAKRLAERGLEQLKNCAEKWGIVGGLSTLGAAALGLGDFDQAQQHFNEALALAKAQGDLQEVARQLGNLANVERVLGSPFQGLRYSLESHALYRQHGTPFELVESLNDLGWSNISFHKPQEARKYFEEGLQLAREHGFEPLIPSLLDGLGWTCYQLGNYDDARELCQEALALISGIDHSLDEVKMLIRLARIATAQGDHGEAQARLNQGLQVAWSTRSEMEVLRTLIYFAEFQLELGCAEQACELLGFALQHPNTPQWIKDRTERFMEKAEARVSPAVSAKAQERGRALNLAEWVDRMLSQNLIASQKLPG